MLFLASMKLTDGGGPVIEEIEAENAELAMRDLEAALDQGKSNEATLYAPVMKMTAVRTINREPFAPCSLLKKS